MKDIFFEKLDVTDISMSGRTNRLLLLKTGMLLLRVWSLFSIQETFGLLCVCRKVGAYNH